MKKSGKPVTSKGFRDSARLHEEAKKHAPGGVHSNVRLGMKPHPLFFTKAKGTRLWDADGKEYVDYVLGMGPVILGHAHPEVNEAVATSLEQGQLFAGQHEDEIKLAEMVCELIPCAEMVRFSLSGSEAVQAALRVARAATGRQLIVKFEGHYHGWFDNIDVNLSSHEPPNPEVATGKPAPASLGQDPAAYSSVRVLPWNDLEAFRRLLDSEREKIAAVIMEPMMCNTSVILPRPGFLEKVRELSTEYGIILIFDEVITGFRVQLGGAQELLGVKPDLAIFAKAMGNGFPISCLAGRGELMQWLAGKGVVHAGTYNANRVSCAAALATLRALRRNHGEVYKKISRTGTALIHGLIKLGKETGRPLLVQGLPAVFHTTFTDQTEITDCRGYRRCQLELQSQFVSLLLARGIRVTDRGTWFLSAAHTAKDVEQTLAAARNALLSLPTG